MKQQYLIRQATAHGGIEGLINAEAKNGYELFSLIVTHAAGAGTYYTAVMKLKQYRGRSEN